MKFASTENTRLHAIQHTKLMEQQYSSQINDSVSNTTIYGGDSIQPLEHNSIDIPQVNIVHYDSVQAILSRNKTEKIAVLDFASYIYPGEKYVSGSYTQEESLFHHSFLYNVLTMFVNSYYDYNKEHKNNSLYLNRALYVPKVIFEDDGRTKTCDVIVCSAPNWKSASKYGVDVLQNHLTLRDRIKFIKNIAESNSVDTLILGSWGTGIFNQNAIEVAYLFKRIFEHSSIKNIVYAIPNVNNYELFKVVFDREDSK